jgi:hypothetical protein
MSEIVAATIAQEESASKLAKALGTATAIFALGNAAAAPVTKPVEWTAYLGLAILFVGIALAICWTPIAWRMLGRDFLRADMRRWDVTGWLVVPALLLLDFARTTEAILPITQYAAVIIYSIGCFGALRSSRGDTASLIGVCFAAIMSLALWQSPVSAPPPVSSVAKVHADAAQMSGPPRDIPGPAPSPSEKPH